MCKVEITKMVINNPSIVTDQFDSGESADPAKLIKNWKRIEKGKMDNGNTERIFDCIPLIEHMRNISYKKIYYAYRLLPGKEGGELISNKELKELGLT